MNNHRVEIKAPTQQERTAILAAIRKCILKRHFNVGGVDYDEWAGRFDDHAASLLTGGLDEFEEGIRASLAELRSSHSVFYHERTSRLLPQHCIGATLRAFGDDGVQQWHFLDVFEESLPQLAGIKRGDALLSVDGIQFLPSNMPPFRIDATHRLTVSDGQRETQRELEIKIPFRKGTPERPPIIEPSSPRDGVIQPRTSILRIPYFPGPTGISFANDLDLAIADIKSKGCDRLIIDLRGNIGGSLGFARLASYPCPGRLLIRHSLTPNRPRHGYKRDAPPCSHASIQSRVPLGPRSLCSAGQIRDAADPEPGSTTLPWESRSPRERVDEQRRRNARGLCAGKSPSDDRRHQDSWQRSRSHQSKGGRGVLAAGAGLWVVYVSRKMPGRRGCSS